MALSGQAALDCLHEAITAGRNGDWESLAELIFSGDGSRQLSDKLVNTVPPPRAYGILHQIAYWGEVDVYAALTAKGVKFDLGVLTKDGKTAEEVALERNKADFATLLAAAAAAAAQPEPEPAGGGGGGGGGAALVQTSSQAFVGDNLLKMGPAQVGALLRDTLPTLKEKPGRDRNHLKSLVHDRCIAEGIGGPELLEIIESNTVPGSSMEDHPAFHTLFDDTEKLFSDAVTASRTAVVFATLIINKLILANASATINKLEQKVFGPGMIPTDHRAREYDSWYPRNKIWCIAAGEAQPIDYDDHTYGGTGSASAVHGCYIAPSGWMRFGLNTLAYPGQQSVPKPAVWSTWHKAYHGTAGANVKAIVQSGLKFMPSQHGAAGAKGKQIIYASPSIEYSAHYVYTTSGKSKGEVSFSKSAGGAGAALDFESLQKSVLQTAGDGNYAGDGGSFVQWVFEVRVRPESYRVQGNTLGGNLWGEGGEKKWGVEYDRLVSRLNLEWLIESEDDIVCTAVMMRDIPCDPKEYNARRFAEMKEHVGWDGTRPTRPRDYGGVAAGAAARWEYNNCESAGDTLSYEDDGGPWQAYSARDSKVIEDAYQGYQRFAFIGVPDGAPGPYFIDFGNECEPELDHKPQQRRADSDQAQSWRMRAVRRVAA